MAGTTDEFSLLQENAAEAGVIWTAPAVRRVEVPLTGGFLSAIVWGEAPAQAVLVHGSAQNAHTWDTVAIALGRPVVAVDLPGHGQSAWRSDHDYSPATLASALASGIEALAPDARLLVGMSLGGLAGIALAARRPDLVRSLALVDITPGVDAAKARSITAFVSGPTRFASFDEILDHTVRHNPGRSEASLRRGVIHNASELDDGSWAWRWDPEGMAVRSEEPGRDQRWLWDDLAATAMPVTLVQGGRSPVVDDADITALLQRRPDAQVVVVHGAGHSVQGDQPLELARLLGGLLDQR